MSNTNNKRYAMETMTVNGSQKWYKMLPEITARYNS